MPYKYWIHPDVGFRLGCKGYLDFYIDSGLQWGVELLIGNNNPEEHVKRFQKGRYQAVSISQIDFNISEYLVLQQNQWIVLNFISEDQKKKKMHQIEGLWNVVYSEDYQSFAVYDHEKCLKVMKPE